MDNYPKVYIYKRIVQSKLFIDAHFSEDIDLSNIADEAFFSKYHFIRLFRSIYGKTPHQYLTKVRIQHAIKFLQKGHSVMATCYAVGFASVSSFTGLFKKITMLTPLKYQQQFEIRQEEIKRMPLHFIPNCFAEQKGWLEKSNFQEVF